MVAAAAAAAVARKRLMMMMMMSGVKSARLLAADGTAVDAAEPMKPRWKRRPAEAPMTASTARLSTADDEWGGMGEDNARPMMMIMIMMMAEWGILRLGRRAE